MLKLMQLPLTLALAQAWNSPGIEDLVKGIGEQPDAVCDFVGMHFTNAETRIDVVPYRNMEAWEQSLPLPGFPVIELRLTRAEHVALGQANPALAVLEASVRDAAWTMMTTHPKMLRGATPAPDEQDTRQNAFAAGTLIDVE
jgi:hypothetical protein